SVMTRTRSAFVLAALVTLWSPRPLLAAGVTQPPALPAPSGTIINVATEPQLQAAAASAPAGSTIMIAPGTYNLTNTLWLVNTQDLTIRGATNNRDDVVLAGKGMTNGAI